MELHKIGSYFLLACFFLALMPSSVTAASDYNPDVPWYQQEKSKICYTADDFKTTGEIAAIKGNYEEAINNYNKAEELLLASDPSRKAETDLALSKLENLKAHSYTNWPGHKAEAAQADKNGEQLEASANKRMNDLGKSDCLVVTATFGSPLSSEVQLVRNFRDQSIAKSYAGSRFMPGFNAWYYSFSPQVSDYINDNPVVKPGMSILLTPLMEIVLMSQVCYSFLNFNPEIATFTALVVGGALYGLVYVFPFVFVGIVVAKRQGWNGADAISMKPVILVWAVIAALLMTGVVFSMDLLTTVSSGLLVISTIILVAGTLSFNLSRYILRKTSLKPDNFS